MRATHRIHVVANVVVIVGCLLTSAPSKAEVPGIEVLRRESHDAGSLNVRVGWEQAPTGRREVIRNGAVEAEHLQLERLSRINVGVSYNVSPRLALLGEWLPNVVQRWDVWRIGGGEAVHSSVQRIGTSTLGMRLRFDSSHPYDPTVRLQRTNLGAFLTELSVSRIADPIVTTLSVTHHREAGSKGDFARRRRISVNGSVGLVANEKVTLLLGVGHQRALDRQALSASSVSLKWMWATDPVDRRAVAVWTTLNQRGGRADVSFGVEWSGRVRPADRVQKGVNGRESEQ